MSNQCSNIRDGQQRQLLWKNPNYVRMIFPKIVSQPEGNGVISWRTMAAIRTMSTEDGLIFWKRLTDDLNGMCHFIFRCLTIDIAHLKSPVT